jgi:hypothetical protein
MSHREFRDEDGRAWEVWDVHPSNFEPQLASVERSGRRTGRMNLPNELLGGWLAFKSDGESRRLAPIPNRWVALDDQDLALLVRIAKPIGRVTPKSSV